MTGAMVDWILTKQKVGHESIGETEDDGLQY